MQIIRYLSISIAFVYCATSFPACAQSRSLAIYGNQSTLYFRTSPKIATDKHRPRTVQEQIKECWAVPHGRRLPSVTIRASFEPDGSLVVAQLPESAKRRYYSDVLYKEATNRAFSAFRRCTPLKVLPSTPYNTWQSVTIIF